MGLLSCGLEEFYFIDYIPPGDYVDTTRAVIILPSTSRAGYNYVDSFIIFYRIYISGINPTGRIETADERSQINPSLNSDFTAIYPSTDFTSTSVSTSNLESTFYNTRKYFALALEGADIDRVLSSGELEKTLEIAFPPNTGERPTLRLNNETQYFLQRANNNPSLLFNPEPEDRYFLNHPDLYDPAKAPPAAANINADVAINSRPDTTPRYTYVSMYIAAKGRSTEMPPRYIYSQPTFLGIFRLADSS
jgi:hypothetical protein